MAQKNTKQNQQDILNVTKTAQYKTITELYQRSQPSSAYYTLLLLSSFIIASGLLLGNSAIVIGGMLVTPVLTPILLIALALSVGEPRSLKNASLLVLKSAGIIMVVGFVMALIFGSLRDASLFLFENSLRGGILYFVVALVSGVAATFAWVRKETAEILPGIAVSVSLVPPLSLLGIGLSGLEFQTARFGFLIFIFNLVGVIVGSMLVFSFLKFYKNEQTIEKEAREQEKAQHANAEKK